MEKEFLQPNHSQIRIETSNSAIESTVYYYEDSEADTGPAPHSPSETQNPTRQILETAEHLASAGKMLFPPPSPLRTTSHPTSAFSRDLVRPPPTVQDGLSRPINSSAPDSYAPAHVRGIDVRASPAPAGSSPDSTRQGPRPSFQSGSYVSYSAPNSAERSLKRKEEKLISPSAFFEMVEKGKAGRAPCLADRNCAAELSSRDVPPSYPPPSCVSRFSDQRAQAGRQKSIEERNPLGGYQEGLQGEPRMLPRDGRDTGRVAPMAVPLVEPDQLARDAAAHNYHLVSPAVAAWPPFQTADGDCLAIQKVDQASRVPSSKPSPSHSEPPSSSILASSHPSATAPASFAVGREAKTLYPDLSQGPAGGSKAGEPWPMEAMQYRSPYYSGGSNIRSQAGGGAMRLHIDQPGHFAGPEMIASIMRNNPVCADCTARNPTWLSVNIGCVVCTKCCSAHRSLGSDVSKIKSLKLDRIPIRTAETVFGNQVVNEEFEFNVPTEYKKPNETMGIKARKHYIKLKYVVQKFRKTPGLFRQPPVVSSKSEICSNKIFESEGLLSIHIKKTEANTGSNFFLEFSNGDEKAVSNLIPNSSKVYTDHLKLKMEDIASSIHVKMFSKGILGAKLIGEGSICFEDSSPDIRNSFHNGSDVEMLVCFQGFSVNVLYNLQKIDI